VSGAPAAHSAAHGPASGAFTVYPAIDLARGRAVRLHQGRREALRVVADDPVALAARLRREGARFLHLVDLDAAFGDGDNLATVARIVAEAGCPVQVGGGLRTQDACRRALAMGAARVVVGTAALRRPDVVEALVRDDPEQVVVAADARAGRVVLAGWTEDGGATLGAFAARVAEAGVRHLLVTAVERDGTGAGPDHAVLREALAGFGPGVIASGGVGAVADVTALRPLAAAGLAGVVVGSLLVDGRARVGELHRAAAGFAGPGVAGSRGRAR